MKTKPRTGGDGRGACCVVSMPVLCRRYGDVMAGYGGDQGSEAATSVAVSASGSTIAEASVVDSVVAVAASVVAVAASVVAGLSHLSSQRKKTRCQSTAFCGFEDLSFGGL